MKKQKARNNQIVKKVVSTLADQEAREWPPVCIGFVHQPIRPRNTSCQKEEIIKNPNK